jgi:hypothetical protein
MPIKSTTGGASARGFGLFGGAGAFPVILTISSTTQDYDLYNAAITAGWDGVKAANVSLTINPGVSVHSGSPSTSALLVPSSFPAQSKVTITNNGIIVGRGGDGGSAQGAHGPGANNPGFPGTPGGPALLASRPITLVNTGTVAGGGGGGGGGAGQASRGRAYGGGGGGGVTYGNAGGGGPREGRPGTPGTATTGGDPGPGSFPGGYGGGYGQPGGDGANAFDGSGGIGGGSGNSINGYSYVTLTNTGQVLGPTTG